MIDIQGIEEEIKRLENEQTSYQTCSKLSVLYSVLDHNKKDETRSLSGSSEFLILSSKAPIDKVMQIINEHMEAVRIIYPKEYTMIIQRIKELGTL